MLSNGNSFANGNSMDLGDSGSAVSGTRPPSWWFTFPADPRWQM